VRFAEPLALLTLLLAPLALVLHRLLEKRFAARIAAAGDPVLFAEMSSPGLDRARAVRLLQAILLAAALALVALALARPQFGVKTEVRKARGMNLVVAVDLSRSMLARDVVPSRLERARVELSALVDQLSGDRVGLVGFTSVAIPICPLTVDHAAWNLQLRGARPEDLPRGGTAIADAIRASEKLLDTAAGTSGGRAILVVTDGEEHEGDPEAAAKEARQKGIEVHVVGVGSKSGEPIPLVDDKGQPAGYLKDAQGETVISRLNEKMLTTIAEAGGGLAALPGSTGGLELGPIRAHLAQMKREERDKLTVSVREERYRWALIPAFLLLLLATLVRPARPRARIVMTLLGVALFGAAPRRAEAGPFEREHHAVKDGNQALSDGRAKDALEAYQRAKTDLGDDPRLLYDRGLAEAASGEKDAAVSSLKAALAGSSDPAVRAQAALALGNIQRGLKKYDEAIQAYRQALLDDPKNAAARKNLEIARAQKRIQALQPKDPNQPKQPGDDKKDEPKGEDGGPPDSGPAQDSGSGSGEDSGGAAPDAGPGGDSGGAGGADSGAGGEDGGGASSGEDGGAAKDGGGASQAEQPPKEQAQPPEETDAHPEADQILDALQQQEKALKHKMLQKQIRPKKVEKDW
jgi:Ca-activated chloride channel family protein